MSVRAACVSASIFLLGALVLLPLSPPPAPVFELEIPELALAPGDQAEIIIPSPSLKLLHIHLRKPEADLIDYGQIFPFINGEAAATVSQVVPTERGKLVKVNLAMRPALHLVDGRNTVEIRAANQRGRIFYGSFVLKTATENRNSDFAYEVRLGDDARQQVPPELALLEPEGAVVLPANRRTRLRIAGVATAANEVVRVLVGGAPVPLKRGSDVTLRKLGLANESNRVTFDTMLAAPEGAREILVEAADASGNSTQVRVPLVYESAAPVQFNGRKFALLLGVSRFAQHAGGLFDLRYADADARTLREFLITAAAGRFRPEDILLLTNEQVTLANLRAALNTFVARAGPDDLLLIFLSTHGTPDPFAPQNLYFLTFDSHVDRLAESALAMNDFQRLLQQNVRARRLVLLVDTCHAAGITGSQGEMARGAANNLVSLYAEKLLYREEGKAVITSSDVNESSQESPRWGGGHGVFTHFLLEGLRGAADRDADGVVTVGELFQFVRQKVRLETQFRQNPRVLAGTNERLSLAVIPQPSPRRSQ